MTDRLTIRMYDMGFGDCFLLTFWSDDSARRILFDCGSLSRPKAEVATIAKHLVAACTPEGGRPRIELVVCTHRHKDHVSGFDDAVWANVEVGEVWMPWTENPADPKATRIRERQSAFALALCESVAPNVSHDTLPLAEPRAGGRRPAGRRTAAAAKDARLALALNALTNEKAMATLHGGFAGRPPRRFLPVEGVEAEARTLASLPGIRFHILGPSRREDVIRDMDPPAGKAYLAMRGVLPDSRGAGGACDTGWHIDEATFRQQRTNEDGGIDTTFDDDDRKALEALADEPGGNLAAAIDNAVNNTSLMIMIEVGNQYLLFPGDAQWGTWNAVLRQPVLRNLLARTTVLKVSHHGSHNGTPREFLETVIGAGVTTFVSTGKIKQWPDIPRAPLIEALSEKTTLARSDDEAAVDSKAAFTVQRDFFVEWQTAVEAA